MPRVARQRGEGRAQQQGRGEILHQYEQPVALDIVSLEWGGASGRARVAVLHDRLGNIEALPARPTGAQSQVGVLAVEKEIVVKTADLLQHRPPVERRRSAGAQHLLTRGEILVRRKMA